MYVMNEAVFDLPDVGFVDKTVHDLDAELPGDRALGFLVVRTPMAPGASLREAVEEHLLREAKRLPGYRILDDHELSIGGEPAIGVRSRWRYDKGDLYTREAHVAAGGLRLTFAMTAPLDHKDGCDQSLSHVISTFRFR
jgi:hypothetical protein